MSEFHYVRTTGVDGGVDAVDGPAVGIGLDELLTAGLPPFKIALEIVAALCEILDIAEEDGEVHGGVSPRCVFLDDTGAVSLEYGATRDSRAPERVAKGAMTDRYGLGYVALRLLSGLELPDVRSADHEAHDDAIIDAILAVDLSGLPEAILGDIQWFLGKLLSFEPDERPAALDAWRSFIAFADATEGPALDRWAREAVDGGGERRKPAPGGVVAAGPGAGPAAPAPVEAAVEAPVEVPSESLGGPSKSSGPLKRGAIDFSTEGGKPGQATAFWSRDQMRAALEDEDDDDGGFKPAVGGGSATAFWSREEMQAMAMGSAEAPRPKRGAGKAAERHHAASPASPSAPPPVAGPPSVPGPVPAAAPPPPPAGGPAPRSSKYHAPTRPPEIDEDAEVPLAHQPGGGWRPGQAAPAAPLSEEPPPRATRKPAETSFMPPPQRPEPPAPPPSPPQRAVGGPVAGGPVAGGPVAAPPFAGGPVAGGPVAAPGNPSPTAAPIGGAPPFSSPGGGPLPPPTWEEPEEAGGGPPIGALIAGVLVLLVGALCLGGVIVGGGWYAMSSGEEAPAPEPTVAPTPSSSPSSAPAPAPSPSPSPRAGRDTARPTPTPAPTTAPSPSPRPAPSTGTAPRPRPSPRPAPAPAPEPTGGPATVTFRTSVRVDVACGDGQRRGVDGSDSLTFEAYKLPVACAITTPDGGVTSVTISQGGASTVSCSGSGSRFGCTGP